MNYSELYFNKITNSITDRDCLTTASMTKRYGKYKALEERFAMSKAWDFKTENVENKLKQMATEDELAVPQK